MDRPKDEGRDFGSMACDYSIIICTRNREHLLKRVLDFHACLDARYQLSHEYVIVDNHSSDATPEVVAGFSKQVECPVQYVLETRAGHSIALNTGCRAARGTKLIFTDDDTLPAATWFASIDEAFRNHDADWVFGPVVPRWEFGPAPAWYGRQTSRFFACFDLGDRVLIDGQVTGCFVGANHACRRSKIFELGLYDEDLGIRGDGLSYAGNDDDLFRRARAAGFKMVYSPQVVVEHLIAEKRYAKATHRRTFWATGENEFRRMRQSPPPYKLWFGLPRFYFAHLMSQVTGFVAAMIARDRSRSFYHETQVIRFGSAILAAIRQRVVPRAASGGFERQATDTKH